VPQVQKALDGEYVLLGPGYSALGQGDGGPLAASGDHPDHGGEAAELTLANKFLFRTSFRP